jgi:dipeptidyl aminopeptidase/acylaminoacyl peptidase
LILKEHSIMSTESNIPTWVMQFPGNFRWSNAFQIQKGMAPYGAVSLGEIDRIAQKMRARQHEKDHDKIWLEEWEAMANKVEHEADEAVKKDHSYTAGNLYIRAGNYHFAAERFIEPGEEKLKSYRKSLRCYHEGYARRYPNMERVQVPFEGNMLPAYFLKATNGKEKAPTVVLFNGMDNCKEMSVLFVGLELSKRGFNTLAIDGPGQAETLRILNIPGRPDYEVVGTAAYDFVTARKDVDPNKVIIMGYSLGGYYAPRIAGIEKRYAACVAFGAMHWSLYDWQIEMQRKITANPSASFSSSFQFRWVVGAPDNETAIEWAKGFTLEGIASQITCPFLVVHGTEDGIVPVEWATRLYDEVGSKNKTIKLFDAEEGGAEHCQVDDRQRGVDFIADWITDNIK